MDAENDYITKDQVMESLFAINYLPFLEYK